jgi:hypothetical protein
VVSWHIGIMYGILASLLSGVPSSVILTGTSALHPLWRAD